MINNSENKNFDKYIETCKKKLIEINKTINPPSNVIVNNSNENPYEKYDNSAISILKMIEHLSNISSQINNDKKIKNSITDLTKEIELTFNILKKEFTLFEITNKKEIILEKLIDIHFAVFGISSIPIDKAHILNFKFTYIEAKLLLLKNKSIDLPKIVISVFKRIMNIFFKQGFLIISVGYGLYSIIVIGINMYNNNGNKSIINILNKKLKEKKIPEETLCSNTTFIEYYNIIIQLISNIPEKKFKEKILKKIENFKKESFLYAEKIEHLYLKQNNDSVFLKKIENLYSLPNTLETTPIYQIINSIKYKKLMELISQEIELINNSKNENIIFPKNSLIITLISSTLYFIFK